MNDLLRHITTLYSKFLQFYPRGFQEEFAEEMQVVFRDSLNEALYEGMLSSLFFCLKEFGELPFHILHELWHELKKKEKIMDSNEKTKSKSVINEQASHWDALIGTLPFMLFGLASMMGKLIIPFLGIYAGLVFYVIVLLGLLTGLIKGVPRWTYSYLGWSLVFALWWSSMGTSGLKIFGFQINYWTWQTWPPLLAAISIALLWTRSLHPLRQLVRGIWQDWTLLSLAMYSFVGFVMLLYDEVRSPYTIAFMAASTLLISASVWIFMRSESHLHRLGILLGGFFTGLLIDRICATTWDLYTYNGLPAQPPMPWYSTLLEIIVFTVLWSPIVWLPVLVGLFKSTYNKELTS